MLTPEAKSSSRRSRRVCRKSCFWWERSIAHNSRGSGEETSEEVLGCEGRDASSDWQGQAKAGGTSEAVGKERESVAEVAAVGKGLGLKISARLHSPAEGVLLSGDAVLSSAANALCRVAPKETSPLRLQQPLDNSASALLRPDSASGAARGGASREGEEKEAPFLLADGTSLFKPTSALVVASIKKPRRVTARTWAVEDNCERTWPAAAAVEDRRRASSSPSPKGAVCHPQLPRPFNVCSPTLQVRDEPERDASRTRRLSSVGECGTPEKRVCHSRAFAARGGSFSSSC